MEVIQRKFWIWLVSSLFLVIHCLSGTSLASTGEDSEAPEDGECEIEGDERCQGSDRGKSRRPGKTN